VPQAATTEGCYAKLRSWRATLIEMSVGVDCASRNSAGPTRVEAACQYAM
jgi:hypothetical protein